MGTLKYEDLDTDWRLKATLDWGLWQLDVHMWQMEHILITESCLHVMVGWPSVQVADNGNYCVLYFFFSFVESAAMNESLSHDTQQETNSSTVENKLWGISLVLRGSG